MSEPAGRVFLHALRVPYADVDQMGFVYYANYLVYFEMARSELLREAGLPYPELERRGVRLPVVEAHCRYRRPARYDDRLLVRSRCAGWTGPRLRIEYAIELDEPGLGPAADAQPASARKGDELASGYTEHVCMAPDGRVLRPVAELRALTAGA